MNNQTLVIYDFKVLYEILAEIQNYLNFNLIKINKLKELNSNSLENYLVISDKKKKDVEEQIIVNKLPIDINKLIEIINIKFLEKKYVHIKMIYSKFTYKIVGNLPESKTSFLFLLFFPFIHN